MSNTPRSDAQEVFNSVRRPVEVIHPHRHIEDSTVSEGTGLVPLAFARSLEIELGARVARLTAALEEVCRVIEGDPLALADTLWVTSGPETLLDHCKAALEATNTHCFNCGIAKCLGES